jgi:hypothetical protein
MLVQFCYVPYVIRKLALEQSASSGSLVKGVFKAYHIVHGVVRHWEVVKAVRELGCFLVIWKYTNQLCLILHFKLLNLKEWIWVPPWPCLFLFFISKLLQQLREHQVVTFLEQVVDIHIRDDLESAVIIINKELGLFLWLYILKLVLPLNSSISGV